jgi:hypothetical protein
MDTVGVRMTRHARPDQPTTAEARRWQQLVTECLRKYRESNEPVFMRRAQECIAHAIEADPWA